MSDLILTGWAGVEFARIAAHTLPVLSDYAAKHDISMACVNLVGNRPPSWMKVQALYEELDRFDRVAWIDADVVVVNGERNIFDDLGDGWQALVEHHTPSGYVPNCGVWVVTQAMRPVLAEIWNGKRHLDHPWWEQAAMLEQMGYEVLPGPFALLATPTDLWHRTTWLRPEWNHHPHDTRRVDAPRFLHVTQYADRLGAVRQHTGARRADT